MANEMMAPKDPSRALPLTDSQREIWFASQMSAAGSAAFNQSCVLNLTGTLNETALRRALDLVVQRHDALRTTFASDGEFQCVHGNAQQAFRRDDLSGESPEKQQQRADAIMKATVQTPFNLVTGPLFRSAFIKLSDRSHQLVLAVHHLICDGTSFTNVIEELAALYSAEVRSASVPAEPPLQFSQFALAQNEIHHSPEQKKAEEFWVKKFIVPAPFLELPGDRPRPTVRSFAAGSAKLKLDRELSNELKRLGTRERCTPFVTGMAAFYTILYRLTGQRDVVIGVPVSARSGEDGTKLVGHCINFLPLRLSVDPEQTFPEHLLKVRGMLLDVYDHQHYTLGKLIQRLNLPRQPDRAPVVPVMFNLDHIDKEPQFEGLQLALAQNPHALTNFDWSFSIANTPSGMELQCLYARDLFEPATIQRWFGHFRTMVENLIAHPAEKLGEVGLLTPAEQRELRSFSHVETALLHNVLPDGMIASAGGQLESYVLDGKGQPTPIGVPGELHVGGDIAEAPPEELADQLPKHPYNPDPDARLYPTGAAARFLPNGDLEIITLREPAEVSTNPATTGARASAQLEYALIGMWEEYLGVSEVSVTDDFFELGGHSLLLARISARVQSMCGITLPLRAFFDAPTIAELALVIEAQMAEQIEQMPEEEIRAAVEVAAGV